MKNLITREQAFKNEVFTSFIASWQSRFDPSQDQFMTKPGMYYDWNIKKDRFYNQQEIDEIKQADLLDYVQKKDNIQVKEYNYYGELNYNATFSDISTYSVSIGSLLALLSIELNADLIFILDYKIPWLSQKNDYKPVTKAMNYLKSIGTDDEFCGAFKLSGDELAVFVTNLFWIIRCNASLPYCWFSTDHHPFVGSICKYGNIHLHTYSNEIKIKFETFAELNSLMLINDCMEGFSDKGNIKGRQIIV